MERTTIETLSYDEMDVVEVGECDGLNYVIVGPHGTYTTFMMACELPNGSMGLGSGFQTQEAARDHVSRLLDPDPEPPEVPDWARDMASRMGDRPQNPYI